MLQRCACEFDNSGDQRESRKRPACGSPENGIRSASLLDCVAGAFDIEPGHGGIDHAIELFERRFGVRQQFRHGGVACHRIGCNARRLRKAHRLECRDFLGRKRTVFVWFAWRV